MTRHPYLSVAASVQISKPIISCVSHCCVVGGNHGTDVQVVILRPISVAISHLLLLEKCMPRLGPLTSQGQILVWTGLVSLSSSDEHTRSASSGHGRFLSDPGKLLVLWMLTLMVVFLIWSMPHSSSGWFVWAKGVFVSTRLLKVVNPRSLSPLSFVSTLQ